MLVLMSSADNESSFEFFLLHIFSIHTASGNKTPGHIHFRFWRKHQMWNSGLVKQTKMFLNLR